MARDRGSLLSRHEADEAVINGDFPATGLAAPRESSARTLARAPTRAHTTPVPPSLRRSL